MVSSENSFGAKLPVLSKESLTLSPNPIVRSAGQISCQYSAPTQLKLPVGSVIQLAWKPPEGQKEQWSENLQPLNISSMPRGSQFACGARVAHEELGEGLATWADVLTLGNTPPSAPTVTLSSGSSQVGSLLTCAATGSSDFDNDTITYLYSWQRNGQTLASANIPSLSSQNFRKGDSFRCGANAGDAENLSQLVWSDAVILQNTAPTQPLTVAINPSLPLIDTSLSCAASGSTDIDLSDTASYQFRWLKNGTPILGQSSGTWLGSKVKGDTVTCWAKASDGTAQSNELMSPTVTIQNTPPTSPSTVSLNSLSYRVGDSASCSSAGSTDADGDSLTSEFRWKMNGNLVPDEVSATFGSAFSKGDTLICEARSLDGTAASAWAASLEAQVLNSSPTDPTSVTISPTGAFEDSTLSCAPLGSTDADSDTLFYTYSWWKNSSVISGATSSSLTGSNFSKGDLISCRAQASDGASSSNALSSNILTIQNSAPSLPTSVTLNPSSPLKDTSLSCAASGSTDIDLSDTVTYQFGWLKNGTPIPGQSGHTWLGAKAKGETVTCWAKASDGTTQSNELMSNTVTIQNTPPTAPSTVSLNSLSYRIGDTVSCSTSGSTDADGDSLTPEFRWQKNGTDVPGEVSANFGSAFSKGDTLNCEARSLDGTTASAWVASLAAQVLNSAPSSPSLVSLTPANAFKNSNLFCLATGGADADQDSVAYLYTWLKNGFPIPLATGSFLYGSDFSKGDAIACQVFAGDGTSLSVPTTSSVVTIQNSAPSLPTSITLNPTSPLKEAPLSCAASGSADIDPSDNVTYQFGWLKNGTPIPGQSTGTWLGSKVKGDTVSCWAKASDGTAQSNELMSATVTIQNTPPTAPSTVSLNSLSYRVGDTVSCSTAGSTDADGDSLTSEFRWKKNGTDLPGEVSANFGSAFSKGDTLNCEARSLDGTVASAWVTSLAAQVLNSSPTDPTTVTISPTSALKDSTLSCAPLGSTDADSDTISYTYSWWKNTSVISGAITSSLTGSSFSKGDLISCRVQANDGVSSSSAVSSNILTIQNSAPSLPTSVTLNPSTALKDTSLSCAASGSADIDSSDNVTYQFGWLKNGTPIPGQSGATWLGAKAKGETVTCWAKASDGTAQSSELMSPTVTIQNTPPTAPSTVSLNSLSYRIGDTVSCSTSGSTDADGDSLTPEFRWQKNGTDVPGEVSANFGSAFSKGDTLNCEARSLDGTTASAWVASLAAQVLNSAPSSPSLVSLTPANAFKNSNLFCLATGGADADQDSVAYLYTWLKNGFPIPLATGSFLYGSDFSKGDAIACQVFAGDGTSLSVPTTSSVVTIQNSDPSAPSSVSIDPGLIYLTTTEIECIADGSTDIDDDELTAEYQFKMNGLVMQDFSPSSFLLQSTPPKGTAIQCVSRFKDNENGTSPASEAASVTVQNSPPTPPSTVSISPESPVVTNTLTCSANGHSDSDGDILVLQFSWTKNETTIVGANTSTLTPANFTGNDIVACVVKSHDGTIASSPVSSNATTITLGPLLSLKGTTPSTMGGSVSSSRTFTIEGSVQNSSQVTGYLTSDCSGPAYSTITANNFNTSGITVNLSLSQILVNVSARSADTMGNLSNCVGGVSYFRSSSSVANFVDSAAVLTTLHSNPTLGETLNNSYVFAATSAEHGTELWVTNGTPADTLLLKDINLSGSSAPANFTRMGNFVYFSADDGVVGRELWRTDGTSNGTTLVRDIRVGGTASNPAFLYAAGPVLYFAADDGSNGIEMWKSDGTSGGTAMVSNIASTSTSSNPRGFRLFKGLVYFQASNSAAGAELWRTDGTASGTTLVSNIRPGTASSSPTNLIEANGYLLFLADDGTNGQELWRNDGTVSTLVANIMTTAGTGSSITSITLLGGQIYFWANHLSWGNELWKSDGTPSGTVLVKDIRSGTSSSKPTAVSLIASGSRLYFGAQDSTTFGVELWTSDGTSTGTVMVRDIATGTTSSNPQNMVAWGTSSVLFQANGELFVSDGTSVGTAMVKDLSPSTTASAPRNLIRLGNQVIFSADDGVVGLEPWRSDGTNDGTVILKNIADSPSANLANQFATTSNGLTFFVGTDAINGLELWVSDGTSGGTYLVKDIQSGSGGSAISGLRAVGDLVYFSATTTASGSEPWRSDGTSAGTSQLAELATGATGSSPTSFVALGSSVIFAATSTAAGSELYISSGSGATLIRDIRSGTSGSSPTGLFSNGISVYFSANDGSSGNELWMTDGTNSGTVLVRDINPGTPNSDPAEFVTFGSRTCFRATTAAQGAELWCTDGTNANTSMIKDIRTGTNGSVPSTFAVSNGVLYFQANDGTRGSELFRSDGSSAGTVLVRDIYSGGTSSSIAQMVPFGNGVAFVASNGTTNAAELWKSDGTSGGTVQVRNIYPTSNYGSNILGLTSAGGALFFFANDGTNGQDFWMSDGTTNGTMRLFDSRIQVGGQSNIRFDGQRLYFGGVPQGQTTGSLFTY